ncbi:hypothetical protein PPACK8108_LOCUS1582, partial [Phakopsora pachyrhizi]
MAQRFLPSILLYLVVLSLVSAQDGTRNLVFPNQNSNNQSNTNTNTNTNTNNNANTNTNTNAVTNTHQSNTTATNNNSTSSGNISSNSTNRANTSTTTTTNLTSIKDSTGANQVPAPGATGGKANGRYGPDDQYISSAPRRTLAARSTDLIIIFSVFGISSLALTGPLFLLFL